MCRKCHGKGRFYTQEMPGVYKIHPCSCGHDTGKEFESFLERLNQQYVKFYGRPAPSYTQFHGRGTR
jgi:hypothetical protein